MPVENNRQPPGILAGLGSPDHYENKDSVLRRADPLGPPHAVSTIGVCYKANALEDTNVHTLLRQSVENFPKATRSAKKEAIVADAGDTQNLLP